MMPAKAPKLNVVATAFQAEARVMPSRHYKRWLGTRRRVSLVEVPVHRPVCQESLGARGTPLGIHRRGVVSRLSTRDTRVAALHRWPWEHADAFV